ncbi:MAG: beta-ketoacyl synthase N-terminal-like domain-containing protein [Kiritimatiellia bacterium]
MKSNIAITGISVITGKGRGEGAFAPGPVSREDVPLLIDVADLERELAEVDTGPYELHRAQKIMAAAFLEALNDAGMGIKSAQAGRTALLVGNAHGVEEFRTGFFRRMKNTQPELTGPSLFPFTNPNSLSAALSALFHTTGPNLTFTCGGTSSEEAIASACGFLASGRAERAVVAGLNLFCRDYGDEMIESGFACECCAMLVLERPEKAAGRRIYALVEDTAHGFADFSPAGIPPRILKNDGRFAVIHRSDNFSEKTFASKRNRGYYQASFALYLDELFGNVFSASGCLGVAAAVFLTAGRAKALLPRGGGAPDKITAAGFDGKGAYATVDIARATYAETS